MSFIQASLEGLVTSLSGKNDLTCINNKFHHFIKHFDLSDEQKLLLTQKGVYPYDYMNSFNKFKQKSFPTIEQCYNRLNDEAMKPDDYNRALTVWNTFNIGDMGEYTTCT